MSSFPSPGTPSPSLDKAEMPPDLTDEAEVDIGGEMVFDDLIADLAKPVEEADELYSLPHRPGWHMRYRKIADYAEIERATRIGDRTRKKPSVRPGEVDIDGLRVSSILLSTHNTGILRGGVLWMKDGRPVTVRDKAFIDVMSEAAKAQRKPGITRAAEALVMAYGWDADVLNHGNRLQQDSGWSNSASGGDDEDPTAAE